MSPSTATTRHGTSGWRTSPRADPHRPSPAAASIRTPFPSSTPKARRPPASRTTTSPRASPSPGPPHRPRLCQARRRSGTDSSSPSDRPLRVQSRGRSRSRVPAAPPPVGATRPCPSSGWPAGRLVVADHALQRVRAAPLLSRSGRHGRAMAPDERARTTALSRAHATSPHGDRLPPGRFSRATRVSAPAGWLNCSSPEPLRHRRNFRHLRAPRHRSAPGSGRGACNDKPPANAYAPEWGTGSQVRYAL